MLCNYQADYQPFKLCNIMSNEHCLRAAYFLGALLAWTRQLQNLGLSEDTFNLLGRGIDEALSELRGGQVNG